MHKELIFNINNIMTSKISIILLGIKKNLTIKKLVQSVFSKYFLIDFNFIETGN